MLENLTFVEGVVLGIVLFMPLPLVVCMFLSWDRHRRRTVRNLYKRSNEVDKQLANAVERFLNAQEKD